MPNSKPGMAYRIKITPRAERDLLLLYYRIGTRSSQAALVWYRGLRRANPRRSPVTPENEDFRHLLYGHKPHVYRVIYRVTERYKQVDILHIRHGAQHEFKSSDVS